MRNHSPFSGWNVNRQNELPRPLNYVTIEPKFQCVRNFSTLHTWGLCAFRAGCYCCCYMMVSSSAGVAARCRWCIRCPLSPVRWCCSSEIPVAAMPQGSAPPGSPNRAPHIAVPQGNQGATNHATPAAERHRLAHNCPNRHTSAPVSTQQYQPAHGSSNRHTTATHSWCGFSIEQNTALG